MIILITNTILHEITPNLLPFLISLLTHVMFSSIIILKIKKPNFVFCYTHRLAQLSSERLLLAPGGNRYGVTEVRRTLPGRRRITGAREIKDTVRTELAGFVGAHRD